MMQISVLCAFLCTAVIANAAEVDAPAGEVNQKLDSLLAGQDRILEVVRDDGSELDGRKAVYINIPMLLATAGNENFYFTGSYGYFPENSSYEVAIPLYYHRNKNSDLTEYSIDLQGRRYLKPHRHGFYFVGGIRMLKLDGYLEEFNYQNMTVQREDVSDFRQGVYFGLGWRADSDHLYWNTNIVIGRFFGAEATAQDAFFDEEFLFDIEFFKFGILF